MKNKKKTIIISAIVLVLLLAVIVTVVVMKQSGHKIAKEPDKSEQTATGQTSGDDEKAVDDELPVVPLDTNEVKDGTEDGSLTEGASQENPAASGDDTKQSASEKKNPADQSSTKKDTKHRRWRL